VDDDDEEEECGTSTFGFALSLSRFVCAAAACFRFFLSGYLCLVLKLEGTGGFEMEPEEDDENVNGGADDDDGAEEEVAALLLSAFLPFLSVLYLPNNGPHVPSSFRV
jgi:hypothetical protein